MADPRLHPIAVTATSAASAGSRASTRLGVIALSVVVLAATFSLGLPFWGDQALFTVYARQLTDGAVLYRDIFDVKQPGIFVFYAIGGLLFGFNEVGIHLFELAYWMCFSVFALVTLRRYFTTRWGVALVPVFTVGTYYLSAGLLDLTQIEILVAFPLLVAWWLVDTADPRIGAGLRRYAAAGLTAAGVVLLKHLYLLIVFGFLAYYVHDARQRSVPLPRIARALAAWSIGLLLPLLILGMYFAEFGQLERIWWAYVEMGPAAQLTSPRPLAFLLSGARRFMIGQGPVLILAAAGCVTALRQRGEPVGRLGAGMLLWGGVGVIAFIVLQGWPEYKWPLFTTPVGILGAIGTESLVGRLASITKPQQWLAAAVMPILAALVFVLGEPSPRRQTIFLALVVIGACTALFIALQDQNRSARDPATRVLCAALAGSIGLAVIVPVSKLRTLLEHRLALAAVDRTEYQRAWNAAYAAADEDVAVLRRQDPTPGSLYVFGDPVVLYRAKSPQAVPILGWGPNFLDDRAWRELHAGLSASPPRYILMDPYIESVVRRRHPAILDLIASRYKVAFVGASGTWYVLR